MSTFSPSKVSQEKKLKSIISKILPLKGVTSSIRMLPDVFSKFTCTLRNKSLPLIARNTKLLSISNPARCLSAESDAKIKDSSIPVENIRNFCIIAHVDHGKSTLADRFLELLGAITASKENQQVLDRLPVEKERGITVKSVTASLTYMHNNTKYLLNLIDTPGHVDFSSEVSRSLYACQGAILLVDANQGVQAQTIANFYSAFTLELTLIPVLNKIDLPHADPESVESEMESLFGFQKSEILRISAKTGLGVEGLLKTIIEKIPAPKVSRDDPLRCLVIDSWYDRFRGSLLFVYVAGGEVRPGDSIMSYKEKKTYTVKSTSELTPEEEKVTCLHAGQVGVIGCNIKTVSTALIGDTLHAAGSEVEPLQTFAQAKPMVFAGLYPRDQSQHADLKSALEKLCLNDPSVTLALENSPALGLGWRLGFLGLLHLDVFRQRLEQEFDAEAVLTAPSVPYKIKVKGEKYIREYGGEVVEIKNPTFFPSASNIIEEAYEPIILGTIITPVKYYQTVLDECMSRRGEQDSITPLDSNRIMLKFRIPLSEIIFDFHDKLKSLSSGYASFDYEDAGYVSATLQKLTILLNGREVEELTTVVHSERLRETALRMVGKLEELIPRQQVLIAIQAAVGGNVIARRNVKPYRKDVAAKLYGGDVTRRMKLLQYQKEGKKRMRMFANIHIERDTFIEVLKGKDR